VALRRGENARQSRQRALLQVCQAKHRLTCGPGETAAGGKGSTGLLKAAHVTLD
jgi:hypothetical protein